jgi:hypothetical protein
MKIYNFISLALALVILLSGCANTREFANKLNESDYIFREKDDINAAFGVSDVEKYSRTVGADKSGFILPDESRERNEFAKSYPITAPNDQAYNDILGRTFNVKLGRVLMLAADIDKRTSGFIKDGNGNVLSVSNLMTFESSAVLTGAVVGSNQAIASAINPNLTINPTQSVGANIGAGFAVGLFVGLVGDILDNAAIADVASKYNFGPRMEAIRGFGNLPISFPIDKLGFTSGNNHRKIAPGLVRSIFLVSGKKTLQFKTQTFFISTVGVFRGEKYRSAYPATNGWEFSITNINMIEINADLSGEERFKEIKRELSTKGIQL